jgi:hypothetical protein
VSVIFTHSSPTPCENERQQGSHQLPQPIGKQANYSCKRPSIVKKLCSGINFLAFPDGSSRVLSLQLSRVLTDLEVDGREPQDLLRVKGHPVWTPGRRFPRIARGHGASSGLRWLGEAENSL